MSSCCAASLGFIDRDPARDANKSNHIGMLRFGNEPMTLWAGCPGLLGPEQNRERDRPG